MGDLLAAVLAFVALLIVAANGKCTRALVWVFNVAGTVDLAVAIVLATAYGAPAFMGPAYWIPAFWVPALLVTHYITFVILLPPRGCGEYRAAKEVRTPRCMEKPYDRQNRGNRSDRGGSGISGEQSWDSAPLDTCNRRDMVAGSPHHRRAFVATSA